MDETVEDAIAYLQEHPDAVNTLVFSEQHPRLLDALFASGNLPCIQLFLQLFLDAKITINMDGPYDSSTRAERNAKPELAGQPKPSYMQILVKRVVESPVLIPVDFLKRIVDTWKPNMLYQANAAGAYVPPVVYFYVLMAKQVDKRTHYFPFYQYLFDAQPELAKSISILHMACTRIDLPMVQLILKHVPPGWADTHTPQHVNALSSVVEGCIQLKQVPAEAAEIIRLLLEAGCTANAMIFHFMTARGSTLLYRLAENLVHDSLRDLFLLLVRHPSTDVNYQPPAELGQGVIRQLLITVCMDKGYDDLVREIVAHGGNLCKSIENTSLPPLLRMVCDKAFVSRYEADLEQWLAPGGALYRNTTHAECKNLLSDMITFLFSDPTLAPPPPAAPTDSFRVSLLKHGLKNCNYYRVAIHPPEEIERRRLMWIRALPEGDDYYYNEGTLFFPHEHPLETASGFNGGITSKGLVQHISQAETVMFANNQQKQAGIPCYLGSECSTPLSLAELSAFLPKAVWQAWKPQTSTPILRGLRQTLGEQSLNAVIKNVRSEDKTYGMIFSNAVCPFCLESVFRETGCSYMYHQPSATAATISTTPYCRKDLCVKELYDAFYKAAEEYKAAEQAANGWMWDPAALRIEFCVECGAATVNHRHVRMGNDNKLTALPQPERVAANGDRVIDYGTCPGGGRRELIARSLGALEAYSALPAKDRKPMEERTVVAKAAWKAATDPRFLGMADQYLAMMGEYEPVLLEYRKLKMEYDALEKKVKEAKETNSANLPALETQFAEKKAVFDPVSDRLIQMEKTMTFPIGVARENITYNNDDYRAFEQQQRRSKNGNNLLKKAIQAEIGTTNEPAAGANAANAEGPLYAAAANHIDGDEKEEQEGGKRNRGTRNRKHGTRNRKRGTRNRNRKHGTRKSKRGTRRSKSK